MKTTYHSPRFQFEVGSSGGFALDQSGGAGSGSYTFTFSHPNQWMSVGMYFGIYADISTFDKDGVLLDEQTNVFLNGRTFNVIFVRPKL